jgi:hypothetical protein
MFLLYIVLPKTKEMQKVFKLPLRWLPTVIEFSRYFKWSLFIELICTIYNMSGCVVSDIQTRAEGKSLYIQYNTDANVVNGLKNDSSYEFIGEVILKINVV